MAKDKKNSKRIQNVKVASKKISGNKFEDLTEEQMEALQGQGDETKKPQARGILDILTSKGKYTCR